MMTRKFACESGHVIEIELPDEYFNDGPLILSCPKCELRYEITIDNVKPYRHSDALEFLSMQY